MIFLEQCAQCLLTCCSPDVRWTLNGRGNVRGPGVTISLTIDDYPNAQTTVADVHRLMAMLANRRVQATFFVFEVNTNFGEIVRILLRCGHEVGVHYQGRWGFCKSASEYVDQAERLKGRIRKATNLPFVPQHVRPPGGCICPGSAAALKTRAGLSTVVGTAYSFDADLCAGTGPGLQADTAALMTYDGAIAIFHDRDERGALEKAIGLYFGALDKKFGTNQWKAVSLRNGMIDDACVRADMLPLIAVVRCVKMDRL
jgi:peptidoglycan/xylan/chitin deacetylase (PgdA/CDA1 family)